MDDSTTKLNKGFADAMSRSFEFALTTAVFIGLGLLVDRWLGTNPIGVISCTVLAFAGQLVAAWYRYDADMKRLEAQLPSRSGERAPKATS